jgi:hypothetical protein
MVLCAGTTKNGSLDCFLFRVSARWSRMQEQPRTVFSTAFPSEFPLDGLKYSRLARSFSDWLLIPSQMLKVGSGPSQEVEHTDLWFLVHAFCKWTLLQSFTVDWWRAGNYTWRERTQPRSHWVTSAHPAIETASQTTVHLSSMTSWNGVCSVGIM